MTEPLTEATTHAQDPPASSNPLYGYDTGFSDLGFLLTGVEDGQEEFSTGMQSLPPSSTLTHPNDQTHQWSELLENPTFTDIALPPLDPFSHDNSSSRDTDAHLPVLGTPRRDLPRRKSLYSTSTSSAGRTGPIRIPSLQDQDLDPMQRWRAGPPQSEAASISNILEALREAPARQGRIRNRVRRTNSFSSAGSTTAESSGSRSVRSAASSRSSGLRKHRTFRSQSGRVPKGQRTDSQAKHVRIFLCTFCCDTFTKKHDWMRHEKSLHLNLEQWVCAPFGGAVISPISGRTHCAYCNMLDPTMEHLQQHNHSACGSGGQQRTFQRKDHLVQHLRGLHQLNTLPIIDNWRLEPPVVVSRCGFCNTALQSWKFRADHLSQHFRDGKTMADWEGDHDFEPVIAAQVRNAYPPYLLAAESQSQVPFSATDPRIPDHLSQIAQAQEVSHSVGSRNDEPDHDGPGFELNPDTYTRYLAWHLGRFAQRNIANGVYPTDNMFQDEARRFVYGDIDCFEQTIADNSQWLATVRSQHLP